MSISEKDVQEKEKKVRQIYSDKISLIINRQADHIETVKKSAEHLKIDSNLPNIGITLNNKINEIALQFKNAGISMFVSPLEKYDYIDSSFVGNAIIDDMLIKTRDANESLDIYAEKTTPLIEEKTNALMSIGPVKKFFLRVRAMFNRNAVNKMFEYKKEDVEEVESYLVNYKNLNSELTNYNLRDNVIPALVKSIKRDGPKGYSASIVPRLLEQSVNSDLEKLGLADLIPQLQETLVEEYKKDLPEYSIDDKDMHLYVPDFEREEGLGNYNIEDLDKIIEQAKAVIENREERSTDSQRSLKETGIRLEDFEEVDKFVALAERQEAINEIKTEMKKGKEEKAEEHEETTEEVSLN